MVSKREAAGQVTLEFILSATLFAIAISGASWILKASWDRAQCAYLVFESTHARLTGRFTRQATKVRVQLAESPQAVQGIGQCGDHRERVWLLKLGASP